MRRTHPAAQGKTFAVIADEAHSSQTGEAASKLKEALSPEELEELQDGGEYGTEDILAAQMKARASDKGVTYVAFTATPKAKTMELFGRRPDPDAPATKDNLPEPFHVYSMRQAIEEGFILDVLQNYTPYSLAFRLASEGKELESDEVERDAARTNSRLVVAAMDTNASQASIPLAASMGVSFKSSYSIGPDYALAAIDGVVSALDNTVAYTAPTRMLIGSFDGASTGKPGRMLLSRLLIYPGTFTASQLQALAS